MRAGRNGSIDRAARGQEQQVPIGDARALRRYRLVAPLYDALSLEWPVYRVGRRAGVAALRLGPGDVVLDIGCGTGMTMPLLERAVGPSGRVVGVDNSEQMLRRARRRASRHGWANVALVQADATSVDPAELTAALGDGEGRRQADAVVFAYALSLMPDWPSSWRRVTAAARAGARVAVIDMRLPTGGASWAAPLARFACSLGGSDPTAHPWTALEAETDDVTTASFWGGHVQVRAGTLDGRRLTSSSRASTP